MKEIKAERQVMNISPTAAVAYLTVKKQLLEAEVLWDVSDSAVIEYLCARHADPGLSPQEFTPKTIDGRRAEQADSRYYASGLQRTMADYRKGCAAIDDLIHNRKKRTDERLEHFRTHPERSKAKRVARAKAQRRVKDGPLR